MAFPNLIITKNDRYSRKIDSPKMIVVLKFNPQENGDRTDGNQREDGDRTGETKVIMSAIKRKAYQTR